MSMSAYFADEQNKLERLAKNHEAFDLYFEELKARKDDMDLIDFMEASTKTVEWKELKL